jgi:serine/threonine protein kinase
VKRTEIAVLGAPSTGGLRVELTARPGEDGLALEYLHDERQTGTLACVLSGRVGLGEVSVPVAVKLQRDVALSQEDRGSVAAKFDKERNVHRRLQECAPDGAGHERIVRQLEVWGGPTSHEADSLEPCILCARARHGLAPRCPECDTPDAVLEELELTDDRGLRCSRCQRQFWSTPKTREAILNVSLRRDPACRGCALENSDSADGCRGSAAFLNFFRNRLLLLERLDLDLDDYLRWRQGEAPGARGRFAPDASAGARKAAREAFDRHRSLVQERLDRLPGPAAARVAELQSATDLFADILAGVEYLHECGVAHLDLKPANVCVRFRGADLDVKVIDLGLSDDPNTLAYLRQAEGALSLWTDYSAPEFRRPRSRPLGVSGRLDEDGCELDWPCPPAPATDLPCPGDLLFFEDRDLVERRFRVAAVRPSREGWLLVRARAEAHHRLWLGSEKDEGGRRKEESDKGTLDSSFLLPPSSFRTVVLEKHCGFPADVYSLGMLLLAVLVGRPDVSDFREALAAVQIELEDFVRERPELPGRALVHWLLGKPSKHLQVFHLYAGQLASCGAVQPLAEELLGMVLRATIRGDVRVFYLADRGADARPAIRRLRRDLEAVRRALASAQTAARSAAVRESRLAALGLLRARLNSRPAEVNGAARAEPPGRLVYPALDVGAAGESHSARELAYLPSASPPAAVLDRWERELHGLAEHEAGGKWNWDFLERYCRRLDLTGAASRFLARHQEVLAECRAAPPTADPAAAEERERLLRWAEEHRDLASRLGRGALFLDGFQDFMKAAGERLLTPWRRALRARQFLFFRRSAVPVTLSRAERGSIRNEAIAGAVAHLEEAVQQALALRKRREGEFTMALVQWRTWRAGGAWLAAVEQLEAQALQQWQEIEGQSALWVQGWTEAVGRLRVYLDRLEAILHVFDSLSCAKGAPDEITTRLTRAQREGLETRTAEEAVEWLRENWPAPSERVEAFFALRELGLTSP